MFFNKKIPLFPYIFPTLLAEKKRKKTGTHYKKERAATVGLTGFLSKTVQPRRETAHKPVASLPVFLPTFYGNSRLFKD